MFRQSPENNFREQTEGGTAVKKNFYETLGVSPDADLDLITKEYRKLASKFHPDKNQGSKGAAESFKDIAEAYQCLSKPDQRAQYDLSLRQEENFSNPYANQQDFRGSNIDIRHQPEVIIRNEKGFFIGTEINPDSSEHREFLLDPVTKQKLSQNSADSFDRLFVRDGLLIGEIKGGFPHVEVLVDQRTGKNITIGGYIKIKRRDGKLFGTRKPLGGAITEEEIKI